MLLGVVGEVGRAAARRPPSSPARRPRCASCLSFWLSASLILPSASALHADSSSPSGQRGLLPRHLLGAAARLASSSSCAPISSRMPSCATVERLDDVVFADTSSAPPSTMMIESFEPATTSSMSLYSSCWNVGLSTHLPWTRPTRTPAIGLGERNLRLRSARTTPRRARGRRRRSPGPPR